VSFMRPTVQTLHLMVCGVGEGHELLRLFEELSILPLLIFLLPLKGVVVKSFADVFLASCVPLFSYLFRFLIDSWLEVV